MQEVQERGTEIETTLLFFELEWAALEDEQAERLLDDEQLSFCAHHLRNVRRYRDHLLTEPEEKILAEKAVTGASAWSRLFDELTSAIEVRLPGDASDAAPESAEGGESLVADAMAAAHTVALDVALSRLVLPERELRQATAQAVTEALPPACARAPSYSTRSWPTRPPMIACAATQTGWRLATSQTRQATSRCSR